MSLKRPILLLLLTAITACDSQVDGHHNDPPLAQLEGTIQNMRMQCVEGAEVTIFDDLLSATGLDAPFRLDLGDLDIPNGTY